MIIEILKANIGEVLINRLNELFLAQVGRDIGNSKFWFVCVWLTGLEALFEPLYQLRLRS